MVTKHTFIGSTVHELVGRAPYAGSIIPHALANAKGGAECQ